MKKDLRPIISPEEIHLIVSRLAGEIRRDCASKKPVLIGTLNGAFIFMADLVRALDMPLEADFIQASCYSGCDTPSPVVSIIKDITTDIKGRDVVVVEDIIDRGNTAGAVIGHLKAKGPASLRLCSLLVRETGGAMRP
ncbi:MAG: hypoxanthine phosphoribosyltransferase, partial [Deltaproteobacteria bacterium]|nr:hypoxanthine phosphoribosyltransferase [Deltaproteobacteria bacterium]